jgi:hypothetical protein
MYGLRLATEQGRFYSRVCPFNPTAKTIDPFKLMPPA